MSYYPYGKDNAQCSQCKYYHFLDSAYGWCVRYPPISAFTQKWFHIYHAFVYPEVPFNNASCGEYKEVM